MDNLQTGDGLAGSDDTGDLLYKGVDDSSLTLKRQQRNNSQAIKEADLNIMTLLLPALL